jgi:hypothetical protein
MINGQQNVKVIYQVQIYDKKGTFHYVVDGLAEGIIKVQ